MYKGKPSICTSTSIILTIIAISSYQLQGQTLTRSALRDTMQRIPFFTIHEDNYFITGVPTKRQ